MTKNLYCFTGLPCSGKTRIVKAIHNSLNDKSTFISAGDVARGLANTDELKEKMSAIDLFPGEDAIRAEIKLRIEMATTPIVIIDGFPRFGDQAQYMVDNMWEYFPRVVTVSVGDYGTLYNRAKLRARDDRDTDPVKFMHRMNVASKNMDDVQQVLQRRMVPCYGVMSDNEQIATDFFKKTIMRKI